MANPFLSLHNNIHPILVPVANVNEDGERSHCFVDLVEPPPKGTTSQTKKTLFCTRTSCLSSKKRVTFQMRANG